MVSPCKDLLLVLSLAAFIFLGLCLVRTHGDMIINHFIMFPSRSSAVTVSVSAIAVTVFATWVWKCREIMMNLWLLLLKVQDSYSQNVYAAFLHVDPARLQYFEYESIHFSCAGFDGSRGWTVMKKIPNKNSTCGASWGAFNGSHCSITNTYVDDSGEYWCRTKDGRKSITVNITVTAGSVILETPVPPVMEGDTVTLRCRNKTASANISASFYKDGRLIQNVSAGNLTIHSVSKSDEGLYRCHISGGEESAESRLAVRGYHDEALSFCSDQLPVLLYFFVRTVGTVLWVALLLFVLRRRHSGKNTQRTNLDREEAGRTK